MARITGSRLLAVVGISAALLQGCSQFAPQAPGAATVGELVQFQNQAQTDLTKLFDKERVEFVKWGYAAADEQCDRFFVALQVARNKSAYEAAELSALNTLVTPGMGLLQAGAKAVGIAGGAFGFATATNLNYSKFMLLTEYNTEIQDLVHSAKNKYKQNVDDTHLVEPRMSLADAYSIVGGYNWYCTLPGIDSLARAALSTGAAATALVESKNAERPVPSAPSPSARRMPGLAAPAPRPVAPPEFGATPGAGGARPSVIIPQITVVR
jgi:hypothetical protein